jgi:hypothetical protein
MPRTCTVCRHPDRHAIDKALVAGQPFRNVSVRHGVTTAAVFRHTRGHLPGALVKAKAAAEVLNADALVQQMTDLQARTLRLLDDAERDDDGRLRVGAIHQARENVVAVGRLLADLRPQTAKPQVTVVFEYVKRPYPTPDAAPRPDDDAEDDAPPATPWRLSL